MIPTFESEVISWHKHIWPRWSLTPTKNNTVLVLIVVHLHTKYDNALAPLLEIWYLQARRKYTYTKNTHTHTVCNLNYTGYNFTKTKNITIVFQTFPFICLAKSKKIAKKRGQYLKLWENNTIEDMHKNIRENEMFQ